MRVDDISSRARQNQFSSIVFDTHADTAQPFLFDHFDLGCRDAEGGVDIPRMREESVRAIFFARWVPVEVTGPRGADIRGRASGRSYASRDGRSKTGRLRITGQEMLVRD